MKKFSVGDNARILLAACLFACATPAHADITYNYEQQWLFDSDSGLYWQYLPIPASTFEPGSGSLATGEDLFELLGNADAEAILGEPGTYSSSLANLLSFLSTNSPALPPALQPDLQVVTVYSQGSVLPDFPELRYNFYGFTYRQLDPASSTTWQFFAISTLGPYGPGYSCPAFPDCPDTINGLVFSTAPPVPLPAAIWLMISGAGMLALRHARKVRRCIPVTSVTFQRAARGPADWRNRRAHL